MELTLLPIEPTDLSSYKRDMQEAFQLGAEEGGFPTDDELILPEEDIDRSLKKKSAIAYKAVMNGQMVGGAIITRSGKAHGYLDFLYVKHGMQSRGIGKWIWFEIEKKHPEIRVWETCTPYFEKRNIHFYINVCGFAAVRYFKEPADDPSSTQEDDGMFEFRKEIKKRTSR